MIFCVFRGYEYLNQQLRIVLSSIDYQIREKLNETDVGKQIQFEEYRPFLDIKFKEAISHSEKHLFSDGEPATVIKSKFTS